MNADFDTIRPFNNDELPQAFAALLREPAFVALMQRLLPQLTIEQLEQQLQTIHSASELQQRIIEPVLTGLEKQQTAGGVTVSGLEVDRPNGILVTNHRDIVMDAAFIALSLFRGGFDSPEIGIGDNLFAAPWIETLVRINKCFVVRRGLAPREMPRVSSTLVSRPSAPALQTPRLTFPLSDSVFFSRKSTEQPSALKFFRNSDSLVNASAP